MYHARSSNTIISTRTSDFDVELCHAFFSVVSKSDLVCDLCKQGLIRRYLHSKAREDLIFKTFRRINQLDYPLLLSLIRTLGGPEEIKRGMRHLDDVPPRPQQFDMTNFKQWDCADNQTWGNLHIWLRILAKEESVIPHPLINSDFRSSAWRSRAWAVASGRFTLDDLGNGRSIRRFVDDHEARLLEASLWVAEAKIPKLAKYGITPEACECFPLGDGTVKFQDIIQKLSVFPEALRDPHYVRLRRQAIVAKLIKSCFDPEIVDGVFQRCAQPSLPETADPFEAFIEYWDSPSVREAVAHLLKLPLETFLNKPATNAIKVVTESEKKPNSRHLRMRRGVTFKHPGVELEYQAYHPLTRLPWNRNPIDYEAEARKIHKDE
ncbi:hypothetical protein N8I77_010999 [Diaporthe amygdali]|uniref:Uncharacterized protein n=1 Tax=Phomopsis amygdali TaxID=1214568 RepID=A0AAD9S4G7_PHOAM|nr:hypothetical protein N8I77_010999 [Diaporthe amygdali]